jgi:two-component sensor histidine kinase
VSLVPSKRALKTGHVEPAEIGGPPVQPPAHQGYGSRLIARLAKGELAGSLEADYRPEGLHVRIADAIA